MEAINIFEFEPNLQPYFERLNREWIEKHFVMEPVDVEVVTQPKQNIIDHGGAILFATLNEEVVGTVALKKIEDGIYELTKMAVSNTCRGNGVGFILGEAILKKARDVGAKQVVLYSNTKFNSPAINLYYRLGFKRINLEKGTYDRADIKMLYDFEVHDYLKNIADRLRSLVNEHHEMLEQISFKAWGEKSTLMKWSRKEILGHLIDSASNNHQRFVRAQYTDKLVSPQYAQEEWVTLQNYQHQNIQPLINLWFVYNMQLAWVIENIHHLKLETECLIGDDEPVVLKFLVEDYIKHMVHHLQQIV